MDNEEPKDSAMAENDTNKLKGLTNEQVSSLVSYLETKPYNEVIEFMRILYQAPIINVVARTEAEARA